MKLAVFLLFMNAALFGQHSDFGLIDFKKADSVAYQFKGASLKNLPLLTYKLTHALDSDVEKFRAIYTWVCTNIENDYSAFQRTVKKRKKLIDDNAALKKWNSEATAKVIKNLLKHKKTACTGYAYLVRELATLADINCKIVNGYGRTANSIPDDKSVPNHSWNAVELKGKWYLCDPTWSAGRILLEDDGPKFQAEYFDGYFLAMPALFVKNHYPLETKWTLLEKPPSFDDFKRGPVIYKEIFKEGILALEPKKMHHEIAKNESISFKLTATKAFNKEGISMELKTGRSHNKIVPEIKKLQNDYEFSHAFDKTGLYDIHIVLREKLIATYVVRVKRQK